MKKLCTKKCKKCRGIKCPNYLGYMSKLDKKDYYDGILNSRKFISDITNKSNLDRFDWIMIYVLIMLILSIIIFGGLLI